MIEGVRGNGVHGDIALDDLLILDGENCQPVYGNGGDTRASLSPFKCILTPLHGLFFGAFVQF